MSSTSVGISEQRRIVGQEGGKIFGRQPRTVAITLLVKKPANEATASIRYHDIGDFLDREEKLRIIRDFGSIGSNRAEKWKSIEPNAETIGLTRAIRV